MVRIYRKKGYALSGIGTKLKSMKSEEALVRKGLIVYEFVGENDVLPLIAEGRQHLVSN